MAIKKGLVFNYNGSVCEVVEQKDSNVEVRNPDGSLWVLPTDFLQDIMDLGMAFEVAK